ncbi:septum formation protein [Marinicella litoralis]|uniref:dTTP/UTP pyrophosphatase n=2 Tax=Marinicella litoralis TaxID=644220 RepID=A0A4R6XNM6_9GAMM|nr:septum formation protein [Marinicella litoralis]
MLASASPRRKQLLEQLGWQVQVQAVDIDETPYPNEPADQYCHRMSIEKAEAAQVQVSIKWPILTADTTVVHHDRILGKPQSVDEAFAVLNQLSGSSHQVYTAVTVVYLGKVHSLMNRSDVKFAKINEAQIHAYIATGEPMDKAGSYGIQGYAAMWIEHISGSYSGIMGLPLFETSQLLNKLDIISPLDVLKTL